MLTILLTPKENYSRESTTERFQERLQSRVITRFTSLAVSQREKVVDWALLYRCSKEKKMA